jgi:HSP20 family protein
MSLRDRIDNALDRFRRDDDEKPSAIRPMYRGPDLDIEETADSIILRAELPGMKAEDLRVQVTADGVAISGEKMIQREEVQGDLLRQERRYGSFFRSIDLPTEVMPDGANASFRDGILELRLPKTTEGKARRVKVDVKAA